RYLVPFEIASVILLVGMVGAIVLARREVQTTPETAYDVTAATGDPPGSKAAGQPAPAIGADGDEPVGVGMEVHR
ncbi:MAG TPA: hypothetical protein VNM87_09525, partial [Candidatus Udaeobacter sp.]|nr:hypothetical protein [Candidatus Udaeobacter sp.]